MAVIKAFKGMRYDTAKAGEISSLCCPPYDIISEQERLSFIKENEYNIIRLELPKEGENPYACANDILKMWQEKGILKIEDKPAIYIYEEEFSVGNSRKSIKGIIARVQLEEFSKGIILPHEFTLSKAKEDRLNLMKATNCNFSQIYALYMDEKHTTLATIDEQSKSKADMEFTDETGVTHRLWIETDPDIIAKLALNYRNYCRENGISKPGDPQDFQMIYLVDMEHPGLVVFPTHRLVRDLPNFDKEAVLEKCSEFFYIDEKEGTDTMEEDLKKLYDEGEKAFGFYCGKGEWFLLTLKDINVMSQMLPDVSKASQSLDVSVLHTLILEKIFGIDKENMAKQINLTYTKLFSEAISGVDNGKFQCSFVLNPTRVTEIRDVAAAGEKMPQKSTYFYPKMITGMVMNNLGVD